MITISQPKIAGLAPVWAPFPGFSLLFDAASEGYVEEKGVEVLRSVEPHGFYKAADEALRQIGTAKLLQTFGFCALPPDSYHVTVYDVANIVDLTRCHAAIRDDLVETLHRLPLPDAFDSAFLRPAADSPLMTKPLTFRYGELYHWENVMVIRLQACDPAAFEEFSASRAALSREYRSRYGFGAGERFTPHLSLGYFLNKEVGELARPRMREWDEHFRSALGNLTLEFSSASLHGFTDMATFFRLPSRG